MSLDDAALRDRLDLHQARSVVDAQRDGRVIGRVDGDAAAASEYQRERAREVELAVRGLDCVQGREELAGLEHVAPEVDLADGEDLARNTVDVLGLDDPLEAPAGVAHDPPVSGGIEPVGGQNRRRRVLGVPGGAEARDLLGRDEWMVARQDDDRAFVDRPARGENRGGRALTLVLLDRLDTGLQPGGNTVARADHAHDPLRPGLPRGVHDPLDHGLPADPMQHLGSARSHPRALAGGHDQDREGLGHGDVSVAVRGTAERVRSIPVRWGVVQLAGLRVLVPATGVRVPPPQCHSGQLRALHRAHALLGRPDLDHECLALGVEADR